MITFCTIEGPVCVGIGVYIDKKWMVWRETAKAKAKAKLDNTTTTTS